MDLSADPLVASLNNAAIANSPQQDATENDYYRGVLDRVLQIGSNMDKPIESADRSTADFAEMTAPGSLKSATAAAPNDPPRSIGSYRLLNQIGVGGMGVVYRAVHTRMNRTVALKFLPADRLGDGQVARRFEREMQAVGQLNHPNIVAGYDAGVVGRQCYLAMELLKGVDLAELTRLHRRKIAAADACELIRQAAIGVGYAHKNGIVHRDVKPSNIMLCRVDGNGAMEVPMESPADGSQRRPPVVKLLDLGLARFEQRDSGHESMTSINQMMGTIDYMSPEQCLDSREVDARSDIYSLGATLYRLLAGRAPWSGPGYETQGQKLKALLSDQIPSIATVCPGISDKLAAVVDRALKRDPYDRFQDIDELIEALSPMANGHDLETLLNDVLSKKSDDEFVSEYRFDDVRNRAFQLPAVHERPVKTAKTKPLASQPPRKITKWLMLAGIPLALLAFSIFWLKTDGGYIRIESDSSIQVSIEILKDGRKIETVEIGKDNAVYWYRSGQYEIRVPADSDDSYTVIDNNFILKRGDKVVATIVRKTIAEKAKEELRPTKPQQISWPEFQIGAPNQIVTNPADDGPGSLRETIRQSRPNDVIGFAQELAGKTINLEKEIHIEKPITIDALSLIAGTEKTGLTIDANNNGRIFSISGTDVSCELRGLQLTGGKLNALGVDSINGTAAGGLVFSSKARLIVSQCTFDNSRAQEAGAVIVFGGELFFDNCTFRNNEAALEGGALYGSDIYGWIRNCTFSKNKAHAGGAIWARRGVLRLTNCTFADNEVVLRLEFKIEQSRDHASGGAISIGTNAQVLVEQCTIVGNRAQHFGAGIYVWDFPTVDVRNSVIAKNKAGENCNDLHDSSNRSIKLGGGNFIGDGTIAVHADKDAYFIDGLDSDQIGTDKEQRDPMLSLLDDFGGFVKTMRPLPGSPLIDKGLPIGSPENTDARGSYRSIDGDGDGTAQLDIGAVEFDPAKNKD